MKTDSLETQVKMLKWLFGGMMVAFLTLGGFTYTQSSEVAVMKQTIGFQDINVKLNRKDIDKNTAEGRHNEGIVNKISTHLTYMSKSLGKIEKLLEKKYSEE